MFTLTTKNKKRLYIAAMSVIKKRKTAPALRNCSVCLSDIYDDDVSVCTLSCSHMFHSHCICVWAIESQQCPLCRTQITSCNHSSWDAGTWSTITKHDDRTIRGVGEHLLSERRSQKNAIQSLEDQLLIAQNPPVMVFYVSAREN